MAEITKRGYLHKAMPYILFSCVTIVFSLSIVVFVGFNEVYNDVKDCDATSSSKDFRTKKQGTQMLVMSLTCLLLGFVSFAYHFFTIIGLPKRHKQSSNLSKVWVVVGEISTALVTNFTTACLVTYCGYPFTTLSDLYDLGATSQNTVVFKDCGVPKRDMTYVWCLIFQLFFSAIAAGFGFVLCGIRGLNVYKFNHKQHKAKMDSEPATSEDGALLMQTVDA
eukprot:gene30952-38803_t